MKIQMAVISVHPRFVAAYSDFGVVRAAAARELAQVEAVDLRDFAVDRHASVDAAPFGGGDGMVLRPEPLAAAVRHCGGRETCHVILPTPSGKSFRQSDAERLRQLGHAGKKLVFICGRFAGVDQRFVDQFVDEEFSAGDFVISGGELPAMMIVDAILRLVPGVLGNAVSAAEDSFSDKFSGALEYPLYTRPAVFEGAPVPPVLLSGDHKEIASWRAATAKMRTEELRPDLIK